MARSRTTRSLVTERFTDSKDYAREGWEALNDLVASLSQADVSVPMTNLELGINTPEVPQLGNAPTATSPGAFVSQLQPVSLQDVTALKESLALSDTTLSLLEMPTFGGVAPTLTDYADPEETPVSIPDALPPLADPDLPAKPTFSLPDASVLDGIQSALDSITIPAIPSLNKIEWDGIFPTTDMTCPEPVFVYTEASYQSDLQDALNTKLYNDVVLGGTGLDATVEQAIYDRANDRLDVELEKAYNAPLQEFADLGFVMPPGALAAELREIQAASNRERTNLNNDIIIAQGNLAQESTKYAITHGLEFEKQATDFANQIASRAFESAQYTVQASLDRYNALVLGFNAENEKVKIQADVYGRRVQAELAELERVRLEIESGKLSAELLKEKSTVFLQRYESAKILVALYAEEMRGAEIAGQVNGQKLAAFRELVNAATAQIGANTARYNLHQAKLAGNESKAKVFASEVDAFGKLVAAKKVESDVDVERQRLVLEKNKEAVAVLQAALEQYKADTQYQAAKEDAAVKAYGAEISKYEADMRAISEFRRNQIERYRTEGQITAAELELLVQERDTHLRTATAVKELALEALKSGSNVLAQLVASALSSVSASAQLGFSESLSDSYSESESTTRSTSTSDSTSISHNYNYGTTPSSS